MEANGLARTAGRLVNVGEIVAMVPRIAWCGRTGRWFKIRGAASPVAVSATEWPGEQLVLFSRHGEEISGRLQPS